MDKNIIKALEENADKKMAKLIEKDTEDGLSFSKLHGHDITPEERTALAQACEASNDGIAEIIHIAYLMGLSRAIYIYIKEEKKSTESIGYIVSSLMTSIRMRQSAIDAMSMIDEKELFTFSKLAYRFLEVEYDQNQDFMRELEKVANMLDGMQGYGEQLKQLRTQIEYADQKNINDTYKR